MEGTLESFASATAKQDAVYEYLSDLHGVIAALLKARVGRSVGFLACLVNQWSKVHVPQRGRGRKLDGEPENARI